MRMTPWLVCAFATTFVGCESDRAPKENAIAAIASANPALVAPPKPAASVEPASNEKIIRRPSENEALVVTSEKRGSIESKHPDAKGFLTKEELELRLFALELKRGKDKEALQALDRLAKGKWILVSGPITNPQPDTFQLAVRYTPRDSADPIGLTSQWVSVTFSGVRGYDPSAYRPGEQTVVLAKYEGGGKASSGSDLILLDEWYEKK